MNSVQPHLIITLSWNLPTLKPSTMLLEWVSYGGDCVIYYHLVLVALVQGRGLVYLNGNIIYNFFFFIQNRISILT